MQTFRKLPTILPRMKTTTSQNGCMSVPAATE
jgi:hypothetical protein